MRLNNIQILRAFAAYLVVVYHIRASEIVTAKELGTTDIALFSFAHNGFAGVDLFFAISGFIMVYVTANRSADIKTSADFLLARIFRIYPVWIFFALAMTGILYLTSGSVDTTGKLATLNVSPLTYLTQSFLLLPQRMPPVLNVGWTLVHEVHFYLVFSLILLAPKATRMIWVAIWALVVVLGTALSLTSGYPKDYIELMFSPLSLEFIGGAVAGWLVISDRIYWPKLFLMAGVLGFLGSLFVPMDEYSAQLYIDRVMVFAVPSIFLVYGAATITTSQPSGYISRWLGRLGDWSFSLYLSHFFVIVLVRKVMSLTSDYLAAKNAPVVVTNALKLGSPGILDNLLFAVLVVVGATIVSALSYYLLEQPTLRFLNNRFRPRAGKSEKAQALENSAP